MHDVNVLVLNHLDSSHQNQRLIQSPGKALSHPTSNPGVFVQACARGFHEQCYPSGTVDLAMSFTAMHWLSVTPGSLVGNADCMHAAQCKAGEAAAEQAQVTDRPTK